MPADSGGLRRGSGRRPPTRGLDRRARHARHARRAQAGLSALAGSRLLQRQARFAEPDDQRGSRTALLYARAGPIRLAFEPRTVLEIESLERATPVAGNLDLRDWLGVERRGRATLLVRGEDGRAYRLVVSEVASLQQSPLVRVFPWPGILGTLGEELGFRGLVRVDDQELAFLVDPQRLTRVVAERTEARADE